MDTFELKDASPSTSIPEPPVMFSVTVNPFLTEILWLNTLVPVVLAVPTNALPSII